MIDHTTQDQSIVWLKNPVEDIIKSVSDLSYCIDLCHVKTCKIFCRDYCLLMISDPG